MISTPIYPDDLEAGLAVVVLRTRVRRPGRQVSGHRPTSGGAIEDHALSSEPSIGVPLCVPLGIPLRINGVSLPFLICSLVHPGGETSGPVILDTRNVELARPSEQYMNAILEYPIDQEAISTQDTPESVEEFPLG